MAVPGTRTVTAAQLRKGMWLAYTNSRYNQRVVDTSTTNEGRIKVYADYGNGGEPATLFYDKDERVLVIA